LASRRRNGGEAGREAGRDRKEEALDGGVRNGRRFVILLTSLTNYCSGTAAVWNKPGRGKCSDLRALARSLWHINSCGDQNKNHTGQ